LSSLYDDSGKMKLYDRAGLTAQIFTETTQ